MNTKSNTKEPNVQLLGGHMAQKSYYDIVLYQVLEAKHDIQINEIYTSKMLCGDGFWRRLSNWERRLAGRCLAHMVVNEILPLKFVSAKRGPTKWYQHV